LERNLSFRHKANAESCQTFWLFEYRLKFGVKEITTVVSTQSYRLYEKCQATTHPPTLSERLLSDIIFFPK